MTTRTIDQVRAAMHKKGYEFFENGAYNLNLVGERKANGTVNKFDDTIHIIYRTDASAPLIIESYQITTEPGLHWLLNPLNVKGAAILVPGQYKGTWQLGLHQGKYEALCQAKPVKVYRDGDKDAVHDCDPNTIQSGLFGINIHRSSPYGESINVDKWSAGCQVFKRVMDFNQLMKLCKKSRALYGNSFTYTLLNEEDFK